MSDQTHVTDMPNEDIFAHIDGILSKWGCGDFEKSRIFAVDESRYLSLRNGNTSLSAEQVLRGEYVVAIDRALRLTFNNELNVYGFMSMKNNNAFFNGRSPLEVICGGDLDDFSNVVRRIQSNLR